MDIRPSPPNSSHNGTASLRGVGILDLLECDTRPTFVLDTTAVNHSRDNVTLPVYWNPAMVSLDSGRPWNALRGMINPNNPPAEDCMAFTQLQN
jgi:hypothetical protein